jgi:hypothetical protein
MSHNVTPSLLDLPIELIYRILDHLEPKEIFLSVLNACQQINTIIDTYQPYQVNFVFYF